MISILFQINYGYICKTMSHAARLIEYAVRKDEHLILSNPDQLLLNWTDEEYKLFRRLEQARYGNKIQNGFSSVDDFIVMANQVLNRRKSRSMQEFISQYISVFR